MFRRQLGRVGWCLGGVEGGAGSYRPEQTGGAVFPGRGEGAFICISKGAEIIVNVSEVDKVNNLKPAFTNTPPPAEAPPPRVPVSACLCPSVDNSSIVLRILQMFP